MSERRVLLLGLDAAEPDLISHWADQGELPNIASLIQGGQTANLNPLSGFGDGATWATLITGCVPAQHGRYFRRQIRPKSYRGWLFDIERDLRAEPFWNRLSDAHIESLILDLPYIPLPKSFCGQVLANWCISARYANPASIPPELAQDVLKRFGDDPVQGSADNALHNSDLTDICERLQNRIVMKGEMVEEQLSKTSEWRFAATAFAEPHDIGHIAWHLHDEEHPQHDVALREQIGDPIKNCYKAIDDRIGRILAKAPEDLTVVLFLGLGMGPNYTATKAMKRLLEIAHGPRVTWPEELASLLDKLPLPRKIAQKINGALLQIERRGLRFFAMPHNENSGAIRINLEGREPHGKVKPQDYEAVCDELSEFFLDLRAPKSNLRIVKDVVRPAETQKGELLAAMPDLFINWTREAPFSAVTSGSADWVEDAPTWGRTGDHTPNSQLIINGPDCGKLETSGEIIDIAPTIMQLLGQSGAGFQGKSLIKA